MDYETELEIAIAALAELKTLHSDFINVVATLAKPKVDGGFVRVTENELHAECLGVALRAVHKPVVRDGRLASLEYSFKAQSGDEDVLVWSMYLEPNGDLHADAIAGDRICSSRNTYLAGHIVARLATALLRSEFFAPNK
jgi:hypothetical protein